MSLFGPVLMVPTQEPASKCGWFKSLFDNDSGGTRISGRWVALNVADSWRETTQNDQTQIYSFCSEVQLNPVQTAG